MEWRGKGCGLFCPLKLPYIKPCLNNFVADCLVSKTFNYFTVILLPIKMIVWDWKKHPTFALLCSNSYAWKEEQTIMPLPFKESQLATCVLFFKSVFYNVKIKMCIHPCHPNRPSHPSYTIHPGHPCHHSHPSQSCHLRQPNHPRHPNHPIHSHPSPSHPSHPQSLLVILSHPQSSLVIPVITVILVNPSHLSQEALLTLDIPVIPSHACHPRHNTHP